MRYERHVFVCINTRLDGEKPSCTARGGLALLQVFQERALALGILDRVAFNGSTCLGPCESGPIVVVYPEGVWYTRVQVEDVSEIVESHLIDGLPVQRLQHAWSLA